MCIYYTHTPQSLFYGLEYSHTCWMFHVLEKYAYSTLIDFYKYQLGQFVDSVVQVFQYPDKFSAYSFYQ